MLMQGGGRGGLEAGGSRAGVGTARAQLRCAERTCMQGGGRGGWAGRRGGGMCMAVTMRTRREARGRKGGEQCPWPFRWACMAARGTAISGGGLNLNKVSTVSPNPECPGSGTGGARGAYPIEPPTWPPFHSRERAPIAPPVTSFRRPNPSAQPDRQFRMRQTTALLLRILGGAP